ncbi:MAG: nucleoside hydrolase [Eubacteriales bacterium]|nr:nucleoside hydrolase [Eubacteriales bacterium]
MVNKRKILMDCDPGIDDCVAIALAASHPEAFEILGVTAVAGNLGLQTTVENALRMTEFCGLHVPVAAGAARPVAGPVREASDIHGANGIGNVKLPDPTRKVVDDNAVMFMYNIIMGLPEGDKVTLVPTGPLTNIALLLRVFPEVAEHIEEIVLMGGAMNGGNVTASAEFNIYADPVAADIVFSFGLPIVMCGLDVTNFCGIDRETADQMVKSEGIVEKTVGEMVQFYLHSEVYAQSSYASIHDAVTFMYMLHPEIYESSLMPVQVDCSEGTNRGMTICDQRSWAYEEEPKTRVLTKADGKKFREYLIQSLQDLDQRLKK